LLQKSYQQLADQFGESKRTIKVVMDRLEEIGVITRVWRNKVLQNGASLTNILYIELHEDRLYELTYDVPEEINPSEATSEDYEKDDYEDTLETDDQENDEKMLVNPVNKHVTKFCTTILQNNVGGPTKKCTTILQNNVGGLTENCNTYTENNKENTLEITSENNYEIINSFDDEQSNQI